MHNRVLFLVALVCAAALVGCGGGGDSSPGPVVTAPPGLKPASTLAPTESELRLVAPAGYVDRSTFQDATGCRVTVREADTSDDVVRLMSTGRYDGALGDGDATVRLIAAGAIAPVNTALVRGFDDVYDGLRQRPFNSVGGQMFAVPVGRSVHQLVYVRDQVPGTLNGLAAVLDPAQIESYSGKLMIPDDPGNIAEAALWVARQRPDLEIEDPYELDRRQFNAVLDVLENQRPYVQDYWATDAAVIAAFNRGKATAGMTSQNAAVALQAAEAQQQPFGVALPKEGALGSSPAWMVAAAARHPGCMYRFLGYALEPAVQARVAQAVHIAPSNRRTCELEAMATFCDAYHADDDGYWDRVLYRTTPARDCGDERGRVCLDWDAWRKAWRAVTRS